MNWLKNIFSSIGKFFSSAKGKQTIATINQLVEIALPIVENIAKLTNNQGAAAAIADVHKAYDTYGVPVTATLIDGDKAAIGNALLNLATTVLQKSLPADKTDVATNILHTAVQLAVTAASVK